LTITLLLLHQFLYIILNLGHEPIISMIFRLSFSRHMLLIDL